MCASMAFNELASRPTSDAGLTTSTRRERSPAAMAAAVLSTRLKGWKDRVTASHAMPMAATVDETPIRSVLTEPC